MSTPLPPQHPERPLRLLALDGGGVRGLVTLYMLRRLMYLINSHNPPKPCDVFDVIAGTSTGGLIAIMLGRLEMNIEDAITAYSDLSRRIFVPKSSIHVVCYLRNLFGGSTFNHKTLENAINGIVSTCENQDGATNEVQLLQQNPRCKIFVCTSMSNAYTKRLRSYHSRHEEHINCTIWEAARATSAAPLIFDPIKISNLEFRDGAFRENNPISQLLEDVSQEFPDRDIDTIVSLGTGVTSNIKLQNSLVKLAKSCAKIATDTETKANDFVKQHCGPGGRLRNKYFRFNVTQGLQGVGLEEWQAGDTMVASTMAYLDALGTKEMLLACAERLRATPDGIQNSVVESIVQSNVTSEIRQTPTNGDPENSLATFQQSKSLDLVPSPPSKRIRRFPRTQERRDKVFQRLYFKDLNDRYGTIKLAHQDTCKWLLTNNQFRDWLDKKDHHAVLWLKGNPGTGKSTIMKFANLKLGDLYPKDIHIHFFFNARGHVLAKNTPGMYRSLLYQLLSSLPRLKEVIDDFGYHELAEAENESWKIPQLQLILLRAIQELGRHRLWVLVDALDEGDESEICDMINFFEQLGDEAKKTKVDMRVLVASRHYPRIIIPKSVEIRLDTEEGHSRDIECYIQTKLKVESNGTGPEMKELVKSRASGVFLWVVLVVEILNKAAANGMNQKAKLKNIPNDLSELFKGILTRDLENSNSRGMQLCMQWVLFAWRPLSREELYFAIISGANEDELKSWKPDDVTPEVMDNFILSCSRGLVQLSGTTLQFIHETVREFLLYGNGMQFIQSDSTQFLTGLSHDTLRSCCLGCITSTLDAAWAHGPPDLDDLDDPCRTGASRVRYTRERYWRSQPKLVEKIKIPFLKYSSLYILEHANAAEAGGISQAIFLQKFELRHWLLLRMVFLDLQTHISLDSTSLYTFAELNLGSLISGMLRDNPRLDFESGAANSVILHHFGCLPYLGDVTANDPGFSPIVLALLKHHYDALIGFLSPGFTNGIENADDALVSAIKQLARTYILSSRSRKQKHETQILQFFFRWGSELDILTLLQSGRFVKDDNYCVRGLILVC
ncbi:hypothetical protein HG530_015784 [Fusarium avenaceum]|nr:hypothetical protein HG530_015784 [Fusarium avenaceum]